MATSQNGLTRSFLPRQLHGTKGTSATSETHGTIRSEMKAHWRAWRFFAIAGVAATVWYLSLPYCYVASSEVALSTWEVLTNELDHVGWPTTPEWSGQFIDSKFIAKGDLKEFLYGRGRSKRLIDEYLGAHPGYMPRATAISNAIESICYEVGGREAVAVARLSVGSEDRDVALKVVGFVVDRFWRWVEENNQRREEKATACFVSKMATAKRTGEDAADVLRSLEVAKQACKRCSMKVLVLSSPTVSERRKCFPLMK